MSQTPLVDGLSLDALLFSKDGLASAKVDASRGEIIDSLLVLLGVAVLDEVFDLGLQNGAAPSEMDFPMGKVITQQHKIRRW